MSFKSPLRPRRASFDNDPDYRHLMDSEFKIKSQFVDTRCLFSENSVLRCIQLVLLESHHRIVWVTRVLGLLLQYWILLFYVSLTRVILNPR